MEKLWVRKTLRLFIIMTLLKSLMPRQNGTAGFKCSSHSWTVKHPFIISSKFIKFLWHLNSDIQTALELSNELLVSVKASKDLQSV